MPNARLNTKKYTTWDVSNLNQKKKKIPTFYNTVLLIEWYGSNVLKKIIILIHFLSFSHFKFFTLLISPSRSLPLSVTLNLPPLFITHVDSHHRQRRSHHDADKSTTSVNLKPLFDFSSRPFFFFFLTQNFLNEQKSQYKDSYIRALALGVPNARYLAFGTPNTKKIYYMRCDKSQKKFQHATIPFY